MTDEQKMQVIQRLAEHGAQIHQINFGDGTQNFFVGSNANPDNAANDTDSSHKQTRHRVKPEPEEEPQTQEVFSLKNSSLPHMQLLWMRLIELGWITADDMQAFLDLFSGKPNECVITWTGKVGVGTLKELFARMIKNGIIKSVNNYVSIIEAHFVDKDSNYLTNVKGGKPNEKTTAEIEGIIPKLKRTYELTDGIDEMFSDIQYGEKEMMDEHKDYYVR